MVRAGPGVPMNVAAQGGEVYVLTTTGSKLERHVFDQPVSQLALQVPWDGAAVSAFVR